MAHATLVLLHSPLTGPEAWGRLPDVLRAAGHAVVVPGITDDDAPPYAARYVARAALQVAVAAPGLPALLVGHSGAGPLLGQVGATQRAARRGVAGYVFLDAGLPRPARPATRLDLLRGEDPDLAEALHAHLDAGGRFPEWTDADLAEEVPDPPARSALLAGLRPRGHDFFTETLPCPADWPDAPCAYLRTSAAYAVPARVAAARGWPVGTTGAGHFAALTDPHGTAAALLDLLDRLPGRLPGRL